MEPLRVGLGRPTSRVVEKSVNSVLPEGNPLGGRLLPPPNQVAQPSAALLRYGCGIPLAGTTLGFGGDPFREVVSARTPEGLMQSNL